MSSDRLTVDGTSAVVLDERQDDELQHVTALDLPGVTTLPQGAAGLTSPGVDQQSSSNLRRKLVATDVVALVLAWAGAALFTLRGLPTPDLLILGGLLLLAMPALTLVIMAASRLYRARECAVRAIENARVLRAIFIAGVAGPVMAELARLPWSLAAFVLGSITALVTVVVGRTLFGLAVSKRRRAGELRWPVLMVGANEDAAELARLFRDQPEYGFEVVGVAAPRGDAETYLPDIPWLGEVADACRARRRSGVNGAIVATTAVTPGELNSVVRNLVDDGAHVRVTNGLRGIAQNRLRKAPIGYEPLFYVEQSALSAWQHRAKRALDLALTSVGLVVISPLLLVTAAAVKLSDPRGPVLFKQERVGRNGEPFTLLKFRTMVVDAEARLAELKEQNGRDGPLFKLADDPRVTRVGRFLRMSSIDELPQLFNVMRGDMSLVGPRPALQEEVDQFSERLRSRVLVLPGITGLWQVEARDNPSFWSYERLDVFYVENWSVGLDLSILFGTVVVVADRGIGAIRALLPGRASDEAPAAVGALD